MAVRVRALLCGLVALLTLSAVGQSARAGDLDIKPLLKGVTTIASPGSPGAVAALGEQAEAVFVGSFSDKQQAPVVVAAQWGQGRVVAFGHSGYLSASTMKDGDTGRFIQNALAWCGEASKRESKILRIATVDCDLGQWLGTQGYTQCVKIDKAFVRQLDDIDVLIVARSALNDQQRTHIAAFVQRGGGLLIAQTGWGWRQLNNNADIRTHEPSIMLLPAGIAWTDEFVSPTGNDRFESSVKPGPLVRFDRAFSALFPDGNGKATPNAQAGASVSLGLSVLPLTDSVYRPRLAALLRQRAGELAISEQKPLKTGKPALRALLAYQVDLLKQTKPEDVQAHPSAAAFPGEVPADAHAQPANRTLDLSVEGWHSLGLYAPAGKVVTFSIKFPSGEAIEGLDVQIGCHTDHLWGSDTWNRVPEIVVRSPLKGQARLASAFGGLVYIDVPAGLKGKCDVHITGTVAAPLFVLGTTSVDEWRKSIRSAPGPWAELATNKVIVSVPSAAIRDLDDPTAVLDTWNRVLDSAADLATIPHERTRPQRYVADVQISAGYMHSGYPIMTHLDAAPRMVSVAELQSGEWGLFHELGHNHQEGMWTFDGTGEVTNNLWSLYLMEQVSGKAPCTGHEALDDRAARDERTRKYIDGGANFEQWKADPFLALEMYMQLREAFGWEPFKAVFAQYRTLPAAERPKGDDGERDQWMVRMSRVVGKNLGPFFTAWGVPTSKGARNSINDLPAWMPDGWPGR